MILEYNGQRPQIHPSCYIAPNAVIRGNVHIGENTSVLFGAVISAEGGRVSIGSDCVIMEQAVLRSVPKHDLIMGDRVLIGPQSHVSGATIGNDVFIATGSTIFNGAVLHDNVEVRIQGVVHINSVLKQDSVVPIGWIAVGNPAEILPPGEHEKIWSIQKELDFPGTVFNADRAAKVGDLTKRYARALHRHKNDKLVNTKES